MPVIFVSLISPFRSFALFSFPVLCCVSVCFSSFIPSAPCCSQYQEVPTHLKHFLVPSGDVFLEHWIGSFTGSPYPPNPIWSLWVFFYSLWCFLRMMFCLQEQAHCSILWCFSVLGEQPLSELLSFRILLWSLRCFSGTMSQLQEQAHCSIVPCTSALDERFHDEACFICTSETFWEMLASSLSINALKLVYICVFEMLPIFRSLPFLCHSCFWVAFLINLDVHFGRDRSLYVLAKGSSLLVLTSAVNRAVHWTEYRGANCLLCEPQHVEEQSRWVDNSLCLHVSVDSPKRHNWYNCGYTEVTYDLPQCCAWPCSMHRTALNEAIALAGWLGKNTWHIILWERRG